MTNVNEAARSAVLSGTGNAGETITVTTPNGPATTIVAADGSWTTTVTGLVDGENALTVTSSDNCAPVALSVIIDSLEIPVAHPIAAAAAAALGLGVFGFGGIRRRAAPSKKSSRSMPNGRPRSS